MRHICKFMYDHNVGSRKLLLFEKDNTLFVAQAKIKNLKLWLFKFCLQLSAFCPCWILSHSVSPLSWLSGGVGGLKQPLVDA